MSFLLAAKNEGLTGFELFNSELDVLSALLYAVIGLLLVFAVLLLLVGVVALFRLLSYEKAGADGMKSVAPVTAINGDELEEAEVAMVMAAIACYYSQPGPDGERDEAPVPFKIRSIYRK